jgi:hypothetical protein
MRAQVMQSDGFNLLRNAALNGSPTQGLKQRMFEMKKSAGTLPMFCFDPNHGKAEKLAKINRTHPQYASSSWVRYSEPFLRVYQGWVAFTIQPSIKRRV